MKKFILFWKKDIINKLIVITSTMLAVGAFALTYMIFNMPEGKSLSEAVSEIIPFPPTSDPDGIPASALEVTSTSLPFNIIPSAAAGGVDAATPTLAPALILSTLTLEQFTPTPFATTTPVVSLNADCIPNNTPQTGKAVSVLDGNTINVLIDGLVYVVRYIGVAAPEDPIDAEKAQVENANLVFGKEIVLTVDQTDKDARGRLLRYVMVGETFVNLKLIQQGLGSALDIPPDSACARTFQEADHAASNTPSGVFGNTPTISPTP
ncbi:MAG: thermonuclease family protein [Chloroflexi bacterium]|nr:thermonuclease family protein [Chloroflexota bacterium]